MTTTAEGPVHWADEDEDIAACTDPAPGWISPNPAKATCPACRVAAGEACPECGADVRVLSLFARECSADCGWRT